MTAWKLWCQKAILKGLNAASQQESCHRRSSRSLKPDLNILAEQYNYTERQKKHHFFRGTLTKIYHIKIHHFNIWTQVSYSTPYEAHLKRQRVAFIKKEKNVVKLQKSFSNITETAHLELPQAIHSISMAGYITAVTGFCLCQNYWPGRRAASVVFEKLSLPISLHFTSFVSQANISFLRCAW